PPEPGRAERGESASAFRRREAPRAPRWSAAPARRGLPAALRRWAGLPSPRTTIKARMKSLQDTYAPGTTCFGCGPSNAEGLQLKSFPEGDGCVAEHRMRKHHEAFPGVVNGGIIWRLLGRSARPARGPSWQSGKGTRRSTAGRSPAYELAEV